MATSNAESIVVMISLGLGMQESMYREVEQSGGMTSLTVTGKQSEGGMYVSMGGQLWRSGGT